MPSSISIQLTVQCQGVSTEPLALHPAERLLHSHYIYTYNTSKACNSKQTQKTEDVFRYMQSVDMFYTRAVHLWLLFTSLLPRQPLLLSSAVLVTWKGKGRNRKVIWMTNGRIRRNLREHSSSNYAISCLGEQTQGERERKSKKDGVKGKNRRG